MSKKSRRLPPYFLPNGGINRVPKLGYLPPHAEEAAAHLEVVRQALNKSGQMAYGTQYSGPGKVKMKVKGPAGEYWVTVEVEDRTAAAADAYVASIKHAPRVRPMPWLNVQPIDWPESKTEFDERIESMTPEELADLVEAMDAAYEQGVDRG